MFSGGTEKQHQDVMGRQSLSKFKNGRADQVSQVDHFLPFFFYLKKHSGKSAFSDTWIKG